MGRRWPLVGLSFIATGLYAWRRRPEYRVGALMVYMGFAWFLTALALVSSPALYTLSLVVGGLWGGVFLHLVLSFPTALLAPGWDRGLTIAGYLIFTVGSVPALLFAGPHELGCDECPANCSRYATTRRWRTRSRLSRPPSTRSCSPSCSSGSRCGGAHGTLERLQLTPVYVCGLLTFCSWRPPPAEPEPARSGRRSSRPRCSRSRSCRPAAQPHGTAGRGVRASRARLVTAADTERRRLERDLHDGAQARLVALAMLLGHTRGRAESHPDEVPALLDEAMEELKTSLAEVRELARGINPAALTERGLAPALEALAAKIPVPVTVDADAERLPGSVATAAYFAVSEALANVAKYAQATEAEVTVRRNGSRVIVDVIDDGIGGADPSRGSGLVGLSDRVGALDGTLDLMSPPGDGTRLHIELPCSPGPS